MTEGNGQRKVESETIEIEHFRLQVPRRVTFDPPLTEEEYLSLGNNPLQMEQDEEGWIHMMTPTSEVTTYANAELTRQLANWAVEHGGWVGESSGGFQMRDGSRPSPDVAYTVPERCEGRQPSHSLGPVCPDFIMELMSPSDRLAPAQAKMQKWITRGVKLAWLIDPFHKRVFVYRQGKPAECHSTPHVRGDGPVEGFILDLGRVWQFYGRGFAKTQAPAPPALKFRK